MRRKELQKYAKNVKFRLVKDGLEDRLLVVPVEMGRIFVPTFAQYVGLLAVLEIMDGHFVPAFAEYAGKIILSLQIHLPEMWRPSQLVQEEEGVSNAQVVEFSRSSNHLVKQPIL